MKKRIHTHLDNNKIIQESNSKYYKRLIVGILKFLKENNQNISIPDEYFNNISNNTGFEIKEKTNTDLLGNSEFVKEFNIIESWISGIDDDGGHEDSTQNIEFLIK